jgi:4-hydroxybenzoate polyprenyltransferase
MVDRADDLEVGIKSTAILFGRWDVPIVGSLMAAMLALLVLTGQRAALSWPWYLGVLGAAGLFAWQLRQIRAREPAACFRAFLNNNWAGLAIFLGLLLHFVLTGTYSD